MAGPMNQIMEIGSGVQPQDNPNPVAQAPQIPQAAPAQRQPTPPSPAEQADAGAHQDVQSFIKDMEGQGKAAAPDQAAGVSSNVQDFIKQMEGGGATAEAPKEDDGIFSTVKNFLKGQIQDHVANFKAGAARNQKEELTGLQKTFGDNNVKLVDGKIMVRPAGQKAFKKFDVDETADLLTKVLKGGLIERITAQAPAAIAQGAAAVGGALPGIAMGNPAVAAAGGFAGGVAGSKLGKGINQGMNELLGQADPDFKYENKISSIGDALQNDYVQGALSMVGGGIAAKGAIRSAEMAALASKSLTPAEAGSVLAGEETKDGALAKYTSALKNYHDTVTPTAETQGTKQGLSTGRDTKGVMDKVMDYWGQNIKAIEGDASTLQDKKGVYLKPQGFLDYVKDQLQNYGVKFHEPGELSEAMGVNSGTGGNVDYAGTKLKESAPMRLKNLMGLYEEAKNIPTDGMSMAASRRIEEALEANYNLVETDRTSQRLFSQAKKALQSDKAEHMNELFGGDDSPAAQTYRLAMKEFSEKADSYNQVSKYFQDPANQDHMIKTLSQAGSDKSLKALQSIGNVLGTDSTQYQNIRSGVIGRYMEKGPNAMSGFIKNPDNKEILNTLFEGNQKDLNVLKTIVNQGDALMEASTLSDSQKALVTRFVDLASRHMPGAHLLRSAMSLFEGNKAALDYTKQALMSGMEKAVSQDQKDAILKSLNAVNQFTSQSEIVNVPVKSSGKVMNYVQRYRPIAGALQTQTKAMAPAPKAPMPAPAEAVADSAAPDPQPPTE